MKREAHAGLILEEDKEGRETTSTVLSGGKTQRGFGKIEFRDRYRVACSLQDSSLATEPAIWFGVDDVEPKIFKDGKWQPFHIPEEVVLSSRMHLTKAMVKQLLPFLIKFAEEEEYIANMKVKK